MRKIVAALTLMQVFGAIIPFVNGLLMETTIRRAFADINALHTDTGAGYFIETKYGLLDDASKAVGQRQSSLQHSDCQE